MADKQLEKLIQEYAWSPLQIQQLRLAQKHGVSLDYFHPSYDWEQLREIRLALEDGLDPSFLLDKHINSDSMKNAREKVYESSGLYDEKTKAKRQKRIITSVISFFIFAAVLVIVLWQKDYILSMVYNIHLDLVSTKETIGLSEVSDFHFVDLVKDYSKDCELILPNISVDDVGEYNLKYTIKNKSKSITKNIVLIVKDDIKPIIKLKNSSITLEYGQSYNFRSNIDCVSDNGHDVDINEVTIKNPVDAKKQGKYEVLYQIQDSSGNKAVEKVQVIVKEKEKKVEPSQHSSKNTSKTNDENNQSSSNTTKKDQASPKKVTATNKRFLFEQYGDASTTQKVALEYGNNALNQGQANRFECTPVKENGIYVGYEVIFK